MATESMPPLPTPRGATAAHAAGPAHLIDLRGTPPAGAGRAAVVPPLPPAAMAGRSPRGTPNSGGGGGGSTLARAPVRQPPANAHVDATLSPRISLQMSELMPYAVKPHKARPAGAPAVGAGGARGGGGGGGGDRGGARSRSPRDPHALHAERAAIAAAVTAGLQGASAGAEPGVRSALALAELEQLMVGAPAHGAAVAAAAPVLPATGPLLAAPPAPTRSTFETLPSPSLTGDSLAPADAAATRAALGESVGSAGAAKLSAPDGTRDAVVAPRPPPSNKGGAFAAASPRSRAVKALRSPSAEVNVREEESAMLETAIASEQLLLERHQRDEADIARQVDALLRAGAGTMRVLADEDMALRAEAGRAARRLEDTHGRVSQLLATNRKLRSAIDELRKQRRPFVTALAQMRARTEHVVAEAKRARRAAHESLDDREHTGEVLAKVRADAADAERAHRVELDRLNARAATLDALLDGARARLERADEAERRAQYAAVRGARDEAHRLEVRRGFLVAQTAECARHFDELAQITGVLVRPARTRPRAGGTGGAGSGGSGGDAVGCRSMADDGDDDDDGSGDGGGGGGGGGGLVGVRRLIGAYFEKEERIRSLTHFWELSCAHLERHAADVAKATAQLATCQQRVAAEAAAASRAALDRAASTQRAAQSQLDVLAFEKRCAALFGTIGNVHELLACRTSRFATAARAARAAAAAATATATAAAAADPRGPARPLPTRGASAVVAKAGCGADEATVAVTGAPSADGVGSATATAAEAAGVAVHAARIAAALGAAADTAAATAGSAQATPAPPRAGSAPVGGLQAAHVPTLLSEIADAVVGLCSRALAVKRLSAAHRPHAPLGPAVGALAASQDRSLRAPLEADERARQLADLRELMPDIAFGHSDTLADKPAELLLGKAARERALAEAAVAVARRIATEEEVGKAMEEGLVLGSLP